MTVFQEMGIESKTTQPNLMILVSFSSAEDVWSIDLNKYNTFSSQGTGNPPFRFFWDTRSIMLEIKLNWIRCAGVKHSLQHSNTNSGPEQ